MTHDVAEACLLADTIYLMGTGLGFVERWMVDAPHHRNPDDPAFTQLKSQIRSKLESSM